eukprot:351874-Chlamydomonas_euryale.AAC.2
MPSSLHAAATDCAVERSAERSWSGVDARWSSPHGSGTKLKSPPSSKLPRLDRSNGWMRSAMNARCPAGSPQVHGALPL